MKYDKALDRHYGFVQSTKDPRFLAHITKLLNDKGRQSGAQETVDVLYQRIPEGGSYYITPLMTDMLESICARFRSEEPEFKLHPWHLITPHGFAWFENPMRMAGWEMPPITSAMTWTSVGNLLLVGFWSHIPDPRVRSNLGEMFEGNLNINVLPDFMCLDVVGVPFGEEYNSAKWDSNPMTPMTWDVFALFALMADKKSRIAQVRGSRAARRRTDLKAGDVNLIYLRREVNRDPALRSVVEGDARSPRRHMVPPHWQRYWVGTGTDRHREYRLVPAYARGVGKMIETDPLYVLKR